MTLKAARVNACLTQAEAAKAIGISEKTLWNYENGIAQPVPKTIDKICSLYQCGYDDLIFFEKQ